MVEVEIVNSLFEEIESTFKREASTVFDLIESLKDNPGKGKPLGVVGGIVIKEIRFRSFRLYFITDSFKLKFLDERTLSNLLIRFVRMSSKKHQQKTIDEIKTILRNIGTGGFS